MLFGYIDNDSEGLHLDLVCILETKMTYEYQQLGKFNPLH